MALAGMFRNRLSEPTLLHYHLAMTTVAKPPVSEPVRFVSFS
jgi:hypothetical protein